ncbi:hypothetical protein C7460_13619 [Marinoscillum furvescens DSM 4134]|uniref:Uncharacterized protein n=1 Tax=Marinoscillum furvescens DSM 4134 TaxID=1122208 RepID=A0A3D9KXP4_MARFU|nr:hypothetical protein C7460_13619 [Marinoscillum furvescens DSM 4134]
MLLELNNYLIVIPAYYLFNLPPLFTLKNYTYTSQVNNSILAPFFKTDLQKLFALYPKDSTVFAKRQEVFRDGKAR